MQSRSRRTSLPGPDEPFVPEVGASPLPGYRMVRAADGTFLGKDGVMALDLPGTGGATREFFKVKTAPPVFGAP